MIFSEKNKWLAVALGLGLLFSGCGKQPPAARDDIVSVKTQTVESGNGVVKFDYAGEVRGRYESVLAFQVGGKIQERLVELGQVVETGQVLMRIDPKDIKENVNITAAQVEAARAQLALATANVARYRQLYEESAVSAAVYDQYRTAYEAAEAELRQAQAQYEQGGNALKYSNLQADADGVIAAINAEVGQVVAAGQAIFTLVHSGELEIEIDIPENRLSYIALQTPARVTLWALDGQTISGEVRQISPVADPVARTYKARVALVEPPPEIRLGMTATVEFAALPTEGRAVNVPLAALYQTAEQPMVWVVEDSAVKLRPVTVDRFDDNSLVVTNGLRDGDIVVIAGVHNLREGQKVRIYQGENK